MQIMIDITDETYEYLTPKEPREMTNKKAAEWFVVLHKAIFVNGKPLPKGHGRLIDADMVIEDIDTERVNLFMDGLKGTPRGYSHLNDLRRIMDEIPTIIEADTEEKNNDK